MNKCLVIDGSYQAFRHIMSSINDEKYNANFIAYRLMRTIIKEVTAYNAYPIMCFDKNGSKYRYSIYPDYKANRGGGTAKEERPNEFLVDEYLPESFKGKLINDETIPLNDLTDYWNVIKTKYKDDKKDLIEAIRSVVIFRTYKYVREIFTNNIRSIGILGLTIPGYEADDIGHFFSYLTNTSGRLVSDDNDWRISVSERYELSRPMAEEIVKYEDMVKAYENLTSRGFRANESVRLIKSITGDGGDNIPGFDGVGGTRGTAMIESIYKSVDNIDYSNLLTPAECASLYKYIIIINNTEDKYNAKFLNDIKNKFESNNIELEKVTAANVIEKLPKFKKSFLSDIDRFELNYKLVGFDHLYQEENKRELFNTISDALKTVKPISQLGYIKFCVSLDSATLQSAYQDLKNILEKCTLNNFSLI